MLRALRALKALDPVSLTQGGAVNNPFLQNFYANFNPTSWEEGRINLNGVKLSPRKARKWDAMFRGQGSFASAETSNFDRFWLGDMAWGRSKDANGEVFGGNIEDLIGYLETGIVEAHGQKDWEKMNNLKQALMYNLLNNDIDPQLLLRTRRNLSKKIKSETPETDFPLQEFIKLA